MTMLFLLLLAQALAECAVRLKPSAVPPMRVFDQWTNGTVDLPGAKAHTSVRFSSSLSPTINFLQHGANEGFVSKYCVEKMSVT